MFLLGNGLLACSPFNSDSISHTKKEIVTSTVESQQSLIKFSAEPGWHSIIEKNAVNHAGEVTTATLTTIAAQPAVTIRVQCTGTGIVTVDFQPVKSNVQYVTLPASCKTARPSQINYQRATFPKDERDDVIISIHGSVIWQAMVEIPD
jgi:hypothetical protein